MDNQYLTKSELADRWSWSLVDRFYPICEKTLPNPQNKRDAPIQLYNIHRIKLIEFLHVFRIELDKSLRRKKAIKELKLMESVSK